MSKSKNSAKNKALKEAMNPTIYETLNKNKSRDTQCLVEANDGTFFIYDSTSHITLLKDGIHKCWSGLENFLNESKATLETYHANHFNCEPPKDQAIDTTGIMVYYKLCSIAQDRTTKGNPINQSTSDKSHKSLLTRKYMMGSNPELISEIKTPQAITCFKILEDLLTEDELNNGAGERIPSVTEETLKALVIARAAEIKTRQDPWRIFQYYRPVLISKKIIRCV